MKRILLLAASGPLSATRLLGVPGADEWNQRTPGKQLPTLGSARVLAFVGNILVAAFYAQFIYYALVSYPQTGSLTGLGLILFNTILVVCFLTRPRPVAISTSVRNWLIAPLVLVLPFLLRPAAPLWSPLSAVARVGQALGVLIMVLSLLALRGSIGVVAANRGIKTQGVYAWVRHPLYAGEMAFFASFLVDHWGVRNLLLVGLLLVGQVVRAHHEEALLAQDKRYASYLGEVRYRFIPRVY
jgi:protein-S-isoprenylcysteine O-methyltransferase Ste14